MKASPSPLSARALLRYAVPVALIGVAVVYLLLRDRDQLQYQLPTLADFDPSEVERVEMARGDERVALRRTADGWSIEPEGYPADQQQVDRIVREAARVELTDLIAERPTYARYELDAERVLSVRLQRGGDILRRLNVGKRAATFNHTFVTVADDPRVFQASGDLASVFTTSVAALRDLGVLAFDADAITEIDATTAQQSLRFTRQLGDGEDGVSWTAADGESVELETISNALSTLSSLRANRFADSEPDGQPLLTLQLRDPETSHSLILYPERDNSHLATSSGSDYTFVLLPFAITDVLEAFGLIDAEGELGG